MTVAVFERLSAALSGRYRLEREVGAGGMATVYLAEDVRHHRRVAIKVLKPELTEALGAERFLKEIEVTAQLQHSHILPLFDSGEVPAEHSQPSYLFYVMPFVEGESLRQRIDREKQLSLDAALDLTRQVAGALDYAHRQGVVHRDIKPENILIKDGQALVTDFGIALAVSQAGGNRLTQTGLSIGSPHYMSPEQATGEREIDARSDVYSLACVLYEMLAGDPPFGGSTAQAVVARKLTGAVPSLRPVRDTVSEGLDHVVTKALARVPADRYPTMALFADALRRGEGSPNAVRQVPTAAASANEAVAVESTRQLADVAPAQAIDRSPSWRRRAPALVAAIAVVAIIVAVASRAAWWSNPGSSVAGSVSGSSQLPVVVMMDSPHPSRVYDDEVIQLSGTNADMLNDLLRDLPIERIKETAGPGWHRHEEILRLHPDLVVMHLSAFCQEVCEPNRVKLREFIAYLADEPTQFLIYSRMEPDSLRESFRAMLGDLPQRFPKLESRLHLFALIEHGTPHWKDPATAAALKLRVKELLSLK